MEKQEAIRNAVNRTQQPVCECVIELGHWGCKQHLVYSFERRSLGAPFVFSSPLTGMEV